MKHFEDVSEFLAASKTFLVGPMTLDFCPPNKKKRLVSNICSRLPREMIQFDDLLSNGLNTSD